MNEPDVPAPTYVPTASTNVVSAVAAATAAVAWTATGRAAAAPVAFVAVIAVAAAVHDAHTTRIPNGLVLAGLASLIGTWGLVSSVDGVPMRTLANDLLAGCVLSGAPALFAVWMVAPRLVGGGDWKLLGVCGLAMGYLAPSAAVLVGILGFSAAVLVAAATRRRQIVLGPLLAIGYLAAIALAIAMPELVGRR